MRPLVEILSRIAVASAIASSAISHSDKNDTHLWAEMDQCAMDAMQAFPGKLNKKEMAILQSKLKESYSKSLRDAYMEVADLKEQFPKYYDECGLQPDSKENCAKIVSYINNRVEADIKEASKGTGENVPENEIPFG